MKVMEGDPRATLQMEEIFANENEAAQQIIEMEENEDEEAAQQIIEMEEKREADMRKFAAKAKQRKAKADAVSTIKNYRSCLIGLQTFLRRKIFLPGQQLTRTQYESLDDREKFVPASIDELQCYIEWKAENDPKPVHSNFPTALKSAYSKFLFLNGCPLLDVEEEKDWARYNKGFKNVCADDVREGRRVMLIKGRHIKPEELEQTCMTGYQNPPLLLGKKMVGRSTEEEEDEDEDEVAINSQGTGMEGSSVANPPAASSAHPEEPEPSQEQGTRAGRTPSHRVGKTKFITELVLFVLFMWALLCRSEVASSIRTSHLDWEGQWFKVGIGKSKKQPKLVGWWFNLIANVFKPAVCIVHALAVHLVCNPQILDGDNPLFHTSESKSRGLNGLLDGLVKFIGLIGLTAHSFRKGGLSYITTGCVECVNYFAAQVRARWKTGNPNAKTESTYIKFGESSDRYAARTGALLPGDHRFAAAPPHFKKQPDGSYHQDIADAIKTLWPVIGLDQNKKMAPFLLAVLVQHQSSGWHRENVHRSHPLWKSRLMRLDIEKLAGHLNTGESLFDPNEGVYKSVILEKKLVDQAQELKEMRSMVEKQGNQMGQLFTCFNNLATQLSVNTLATSGALVPIPSQMEELVEKLSLGLSAGLKSAVQDEFARQRQLVGGASSPQYNSSSCPTTNCYSWGGKEDRVIPESFELSRHDQTTAQGLWDLWWIGDASSGGSGCVRVPFKKLLLAHRRDVLDLYDLRISKAAAAVEHARGEATLALAEADCMKAAAKLAEAEAQLESARKVRNNTQRCASEYAKTCEFLEMYLPDLEQFNMQVSCLLAVKDLPNLSDLVDRAWQHVWNAVLNPLEKGKRAIQAWEKPRRRTTKRKRGEEEGSEEMQRGGGSQSIAVVKIRRTHAPDRLLSRTVYKRILAFKKLVKQSERQAKEAVNFLTGIADEVVRSSSTSEAQA